MNWLKKLFMGPRISGIITAEDRIGRDIEVYYKGQKITNVWSISLHGALMMTEDNKPLITNWRKEMEGDACGCHNKRKA